MASTKTPDIAVVGMACRFPGSATSPERLWDMLKNGESAFRPFPNNRLNINGFYHPSPERPDSVSVHALHALHLAPTNRRSSRSSTFVELTS